MSALHTPGPWHMVKDREGVMTILTRNQDGNPHKHIAVMSWADTEGGQPDAELIKAAPTLLEALRRIGCPKDTERTLMPSEMRMIARAAIKAATLSGGGE